MEALDLVEEVLLVLVAGCLLFLLPQGVPVVPAFILAILLIILLVLRGISWHHSRATPYDFVLLIGIILSVLYLVSFLAFVQNLLNIVIVVLLAVYYLVMAWLLYEHRWLFAQPTYTSHTEASVKRNDHTHDQNFRKGIKPIMQKNPSWERVRQMFTRDILAKHKIDHIDPLPVMKPPHAAKKHDKKFTKGMEALPDITKDDLHRLGVYDVMTEVKK